MCVLHSWERGPCSYKWGQGDLKTACFFIPYQRSVLGTLHGGRGPLLMGVQDRQGTAAFPSSWPWLCSSPGLNGRIKEPYQEGRYWMQLQKCRQRSLSHWGNHLPLCTEQEGAGRRETPTSHHLTTWRVCSHGPTDPYPEKGQETPACIYPTLTGGDFK